VKSLSSELRNPVVLSEELVDDLVSSFGGCFIFYEQLLEHTNVADELKQMKVVHTENLMYALDLQKGQSFSEVTLERYELLKAIAKGEKITNTASPAAEYLLAKHGKIEAFIGIHPEGHLVFALPMTKQSLVQIEQKKSLSVYLFLMRYFGWLLLKKQS